VSSHPLTPENERNAHGQDQELGLDATLALLSEFKGVAKRHVDKLLRVVPAIERRVAFVGEMQLPRAVATNQLLG
jgi:hypothetical protein